MYDIKWIRKNSAEFDKGLAKRGLEPHSAILLKYDEDNRLNVSSEQELRTQLNAKSKRIGELMIENDPATQEEVRELIASSAIIKNQLKPLSVQVEKNTSVALCKVLSEFPNMLDESVPEGWDSSGNVEISKCGEPRQFDFTSRTHFEIGEALDMMDFEQAAEMSGSGFVILKGSLAKLERALAAYMLDVHTEKLGFTEVSPPLLVNTATLFGTGQLPKFAYDCYESKDGEHSKWLIPTSEVSLVSMVRNKILNASELPLRYVAHTPCFRLEAGGAGADTRGLIRQHQFYKVELVSITKPENSNAEHNYMTKCAMKILQNLELPFRTMLLCSTETGFTAKKTIDLEVWLPSFNDYKEISSISNCGSFQSKRMTARYREKGKKALSFVHTLNGSGLAIGRTIVAILENYQNQNGTVNVPTVLQPYMGGLKVISL